MEKQINQHEKGLLIALKEFYTREIKDKGKAQDLVRNHRTETKTETEDPTSIKLQSVIFEYELVAAIRAGEDGDGNKFDCKRIRIYPARYPNNENKTQEDDKNSGKPTLLVELIGTNDKNEVRSRYFNYGQTCPPSDGETGNPCAGDILE